MWSYSPGSKKSLSGMFCWRSHTHTMYGLILPRILLLRPRYCVIKRPTVFWLLLNYLPRRRFCLYCRTARFFSAAFFLQPPVGNVILTAIAFLPVIDTLISLGWKWNSQTTVLLLISNESFRLYVEIHFLCFSGCLCLSGNLKKPMLVSWPSQS